MELLYFLAKPKSVKYITLGSFRPIRKLLGLISLWIKLFSWINFNLSKPCIAIKQISFIKILFLPKGSFLTGPDFQITWRSFPKSSSINILNYPHFPKLIISGIPNPLIPVKI